MSKLGITNRVANKSNQLKTILLSSFTLLCLTVSTTAHAEFRKAVDALIDRNPKGLMKEVRDAVKKKQNDGILLFISALQIGFMSSQVEANGLAGSYRNSPKIKIPARVGRISLRNPPNEKMSHTLKSFKILPTDNAALIRPTKYA